MSAMPAAAAVPPRKIGGIDQNTLITERWPICDSVKLSTSIGRLWLEKTAQDEPDRARSTRTRRRGACARRCDPSGGR